MEKKALQKKPPGILAKLDHLRPALVSGLLKFSFHV
jgi:hypothetical protein